MNKFLKTVLLAIVGTALIPVAMAFSEELSPIGVLPKLEAEWQIIAEDEKEEIQAKLPFRWIVFQNKKTGDFLSFATHPEPVRNRSLEYLSDTSLEIFPHGRAVWTQPHANSTTNVIAINVVDIGRKIASLKVLEYCFISELSDRDNLMAHGRAWIGPKGAVFVQHTSAKPITSDLVDETIKSIVKSQMTLAALPTR
ncbi:MAG: hypothetical protein O3B13_01235 [Planctomycetota bacterium]|nr:hypothetical protein [Planctomycetota bacterium]